MLPFVNSWMWVNLFYKLQAETGGDGSSNAYLGSEDQPTYRGSKSSSKKSIATNSRQYEWKPKSHGPLELEQPLQSVEDVCCRTEKFVLEQKFPEQQPEYLSSSVPTAEKFSTSVSSVSDSKGKILSEVSEKLSESSNHAEFDVLAPGDSVYQKHASPDHHKRAAALGMTPQHGNIKLEDSRPSGSVTPSEASSVLNPTTFDICPAKSSTIILKPSIFSKNRMHRNEMTRSFKGDVLRPGMVILRNYLSLADQAKIIKKCHDLGLGSGGFYQPAYENGAKLQLKMMCLGKNWDPESSKYGDVRPMDKVKPPAIPHEFYGFVEDALLDSRAVQKDSKVRDEDLLPMMKPDICIVNFYTTSGHLGLHQDKDESSESIRKGLPVVSFSFGESARFQYSDAKDGEPEEIVLESGDVLIFGGKSRRVFHGVSSIVSNSAPKALLEETQLRPGRLNLTFREY